jgi:hypothetical protein
MNVFLSDARYMTVGVFRARLREEPGGITYIFE